MNLRSLLRPASMVVAVACSTSLLAAVPAAAQSRPYAHPTFQRLWERYDRPVEVHFTDRSWTWGPNTMYSGEEPYKQGKPGGRRLVQYFDKTRMEINDRTAETPYVTNGLLVREMVSGKVALGDNQDEYEQRQPAAEAVAGDPASVNPDTPTYASFKDVASLANDKPAENRIGAYVTATINKQGTVGTLPSDQQELARLVKISHYDLNLRHNIPDKFWTFLNQSGMIYVDSEFIPDQTVFQPWVDVTGVPLSEPYWTTTQVGGVKKWVLVQLFERRVLTYTPSNDPPFEVEMGNVGQHYYRWRYEIPVECTDEQPAVTFLERTALTATGATIEWRTNKPTDSRLEYGTSTSYGTTVGSQTLTTQHKVELTGLSPNTEYHYRIVSRDCKGRTVIDSDHGFTTKAS